MPLKHFLLSREQRAALSAAKSKRVRVEKMEDLVEDLKKPWPERFWGMVKKAEENECWLWIGPKTAAGYGRLSINYIPYFVHRLSFLIANGRIDPDLLVLHSCDTKLCVNPRHLSQGTTQRNSHEAVVRGLYRRGVGNGRAKLTEDDVLQIRKETETTNLEMAQRFGVSTTVIGFVRSRKSWKHIA